MSEQYTSTITRRAKAALKLGALVLGVSTVVYYISGCLCGMNAGYGKSLWSLNDDRWEVTECLYFSAITLTTTGYGDLLGTEKVELYQDGNGNFRWDSPTDPHTSCDEQDYDYASEQLFFNFSPLTRTLTTIIGIIGMAFFLFVIAQITAFFVEGGYEAMAVNMRRRKQLNRLNDHVIVCGGGSEGSHAVEHILKSGVDCAVIDTNEQAISSIQTQHNNVPCLGGDATQEETLKLAGLDRARAVITALPDDGLNLVTVVTIRQHRDDIRIASRAVREESVRRLQLAGADDVVNSSRLLGLRLASHLIRPTAVDFIDQVLGYRGSGNLQLVSLKLHDTHAGRMLQEFELDNTPQTRLVALRHANGTFSYNPPPDTTVETDDQLLVAGQTEQIESLASRLQAALHEDDSHAPDHREQDAGVEPDAMEFARETGHYVICGANAISGHIARELTASGRSCCIIDEDPKQLRNLAARFPSVRTIEGSAQSAEVLRESEIDNARGLVTTFRSDNENLVVVVTALQLHTELRVASLASDDSSTRRLERAGAIVRQPGKIGGRRLAAKILKTAATGLLDRMLDERGGVRFESVTVNASSHNVDKTLGEIDVFGQTGLRILALRLPGEPSFVIAPGDTERLVAGTALVVAGAARQVCQLAKLVGEWE